jgi:peptidoglycan/LPS O-acetylase OafA/YrhL
MHNIWAFLIATGMTRFLYEYWGIALPLPLFIPGTLTTPLIAEMSYRFYETPFLRLKTGLGWQPKK